MTRGLVMPSQSIQLMLADPFTLADFTDITLLVREWSGTIAGRQHELQLFQPGEVSLTLNNQDGRWSPWNTKGPYYNLLTPGDASGETADGTTATSPVVSNWLNGSTLVNCTIALDVPPVIIDGPQAYYVECTSGTSFSVTMPKNYYAVTAGDYYSVMCSFLAATAVDRNCVVSVLWYTSGGSLISTTSVPAVADNDTSWTKASKLGIQAPATAAYAALQVSCGLTVSSDGLWFSRAALFNYLPAVPNTAWAPGQRGLVPERPITCTATWNSVTYQIFSMYVANWTPDYGPVIKANQVVDLKDGLALVAASYMTSSAAVDQVISDGAVGYWRCTDAAGSLTAADSSGNGNTAYVDSGFPLALPTFGNTGLLPTLPDSCAQFIDNGSGWTGGLSFNGYSTGAPPGASIEFWFQSSASTGTVDCGVIWQTLIGGDGMSMGLIVQGPVSTQVNVQGSGGGFCYVTTDLWDGNPHHVCGTVTSGGVYTLYIDGAQVATTTTAITNTPGVYSYFGGGPATPGCFLQEIAVYPTALSAAQVANHFALFSAGFVVQYSGQRIAALLAVLGWPTSATSLATGIQQVQGATSSLVTTAALSYMQQLATTEGICALFCDHRNSGVITFYDRHYIITATAATVSNCTLSNATGAGIYRYLPGIVPAMDDLDWWNDVPVQRVGGILQRSTSTLSIKYSGIQRTLTGYTGQLQTDDADVLGESQWLLSHYENPYTRVRSITMSSVTDAGANLPQMLGRGIFDCVTVVWQPIDGPLSTPFSQECIIETVTHRVTQAEWQCTWGLSPAELQPYLILNNATRGQLSEGNELAY